MLKLRLFVHCFLYSSDVVHASGYHSFIHSFIHLALPPAPLNAGPCCCTAAHPDTPRLCFSSPSSLRPTFRWRRLWLMLTHLNEDCCWVVPRRKDSITEVLHRTLLRANATAPRGEFPSTLRTPHDGASTDDDSGTTPLSMIQLESFLYKTCSSPIQISRLAPLSPRRLSHQV